MHGCAEDFASRLQSGDGDSTNRYRTKGFRSDEDTVPSVRAPISWVQLAKWVESVGLPPVDVVDALLDTTGVPGVTCLVDELERPGTVCLALAEAVAAGRVPCSNGDAF